jgi:hypothetical protein
MKSTTPSKTPVYVTLTILDQKGDFDYHRDIRLPAIPEAGQRLALAEEGEEGEAGRPRHKNSYQVVEVVHTKNDASGQPHYEWAAEVVVKPLVPGRLRHSAAASGRIRRTRRPHPVRVERPTN